MTLIVIVGSAIVKGRSIQLADQYHTEGQDRV